MSSSTLLTALRAALPADAVITDLDVTEAYRRDQTPLLPAGRPAAVVFPRTTAEVQAVVALASTTRTALVTRGAGSGLAGGANALDGCIVLCTTRMDQILTIDPSDQFAVVQPGVINAELTAAVRAAGLDYPPDPASQGFSTIGGNVATNAGGLCCVKYGVTGDYVLGLEVVLADGSVLRTGRRTVKGVAGYDLTALFVGSEGILGVVTEVTVRLRPMPATPATVVGMFGSLAEAGAAIVALSAAGVVPSMLELMDRTTLRAVEHWQRMDLDLDAAAILLAQCDGRDAASEAADIATAFELSGASYVAHTSDATEGDMLLAARRFAYPALERLGGTLLDDVAVPRSRIPDLVAGIEAIAAERGSTVGTFGHAGDGNLHPTIVFDRTDPEAAARATATFDAIVALALALGGTVTGEHGVGTLKRTHLAAELSPVNLALHHTLKSALDPEGILNPGKVI